jgi:T5SS/PEP-CTERM-associated repeat protein
MGNTSLIRRLLRPAPRWAAATAAAVFPTAALADTHTWDGGGGSGNFQTAANWDPNAVPVAGDNVIINNGPPFAGSVFMTNNLFGLGNLSMLDAGLSLGGNILTLGGGTSNANVANSSLLGIDTGRLETDVLTLTSSTMTMAGGTVQAFSNINSNSGTIRGFGEVRGSTFSNNGTLRALGGTLTVGALGNGSIDLDGAGEQGSVVVNSNATLEVLGPILGSFDGAMNLDTSGRVTFNGATNPSLGTQNTTFGQGSVLESTRNLTLGISDFNFANRFNLDIPTNTSAPSVGPARVMVGNRTENGVNFAGNQFREAHLILNHDSSAGGTLTMTRQGTITHQGDSFIGLFSGNRGTLDLTEGGQLIQNGGAGSDATLGLFGGSLGTATVRGVENTGSVSTWNLDGTLSVGRLGTGSLTVSDGGRVTQGGPAFLGQLNTGRGIAIVTGVHAGGTVSTWGIDSDLHVGSNDSGSAAGDGRLTVAEDGLVEVGDHIFIGGDLQGYVDARVDVQSGGTLRAGETIFVRQDTSGIAVNNAAAPGSSLLNLDEGRVEAKAVIVDDALSSQGDSVIFANSVTLEATSTNTINDTLTLDAAAFIGGGTFHGSGVLLTPDTRNLNLRQQADLGGVGLDNRGQLKVGFSTDGIAEAAVGQFTQADTGTWVVDLDPASDSADLLTVAVSVNLDGELEINLLSAPSLNQEFKILDKLDTDPIDDLFDQGGLVSGEFGGDVYEFAIDYSGGTGNDIVLTSLIPEPGTLLLLAVAGPLVMSRRRNHS